MAPLEAGTIVAERYRVRSTLGEGATGRVYAVEHVRLGRRLALKVLHPHLAGLPGLTGRFEREAKAIAQLDHPHIVAAIDFGEAPDVGWYLVTEFVDGAPLERVLAGRPEWVQPAFAQLLDALGHAHAQGILHRDLKPDNVLVGEREGAPFVTILDFGLAKALHDADDGLTQPGAVFGTPRYMSPEQAGGEPATAASDLYAVGVMLYQTLEGRVPFDGGSAAEILRQHITREVPTPISAPQEAWPTLQRALAKHPEDRFADAAGFAQALQSELPNEPPPTEVRAVTTSAAPAPTPSPGPSRRWIAAPALAVGLALAALPFTSDPLGDARDHLDAGRLDAAAAVLDGVLAEGPNPEATLLRGHLAVSRKKWRAAGERYLEALQAAPDLADEARLSQSLPELARTKPRAAAKVLAWLAESAPDDAAPLLARLAEAGPSPRVRRQAYTGLERLDEADRVVAVPWLTQELGRVKNAGCKTRRWYVERLLATGDEAAVAAAKAEMGRKDGVLGLIPQSRCMKGLTAP